MAHIVIQMVNFILLILILNVLLYKPILGIIERRNAKLSGSQEEIKGLNQRVLDRMADYEEKIKQAKTAAMEQKNELLKQGSDEAKNIIDAVRSDLPQFLSQYQNRMDEEIDQARRILGDHSRKISLEIAEKVLGRSL
ncbi:MAG: ATP synthase F0 subunit B [Deltaproteobacteria bacterium]|nr:ATP synthase F0 subunit B [Deltaproteobacteria bacterium]